MCLYQLKETARIENFEVAKKDISDRFIISDILCTVIIRVFEIS